MALQDHTTEALEGSAGVRDGLSDLDIAIQMLELNEMRAEGTLSEEEFAGWVAELLPS
jgi:hypothetical protein